MPLIKGTPKDGYLEINDNIRFRKGVDFISNWGKTYFVDFENGSDYHDGRSTFKALKNLAAAISKAGAWDIIYIRRRTPDVAEGDPVGITPATAVNWSIANTKWGLQLIGCGIGHDPQQAAYQTRLEGHATVTGVAPLTVLAPYVGLENLSFKRGGATGVPLVDLSTTVPARAFAASLYRCQLHMGNGVNGSNGAVQINSHWYAAIIECHFERCAVAIGLYSGISNPAAVHIRGNTFNQPAADNKGDIVSAATACHRIMIEDNTFNHDTPSAGGTNKFLYFPGSANTGSIIGNKFGTATLVTATLMTLGGLVESGSICGKGFLTS